MIPVRSMLPAVLVLVPLLGISHDAWAQPGRPATEVEVINTPSVEVTNTPDVRVVNTPSVEVTNVPEVEVINVPTVDLLAGAEVRDRDNPALEPTQFRCEFALVNLQQVDSQLCGDPLPPGQTLVIEYYSVRVVSPQRPTVRLTLANRDPSGVPRGIEWNIPMDDCGPVSPGSNCWQAAGPVRLYRSVFDLVLFLSRQGPFTGAATITADFSGYYVTP
jgi:hypothetical protein